MDRDREEFQHDWYAILGCEVGATIEVIQKAARKLAVKYHPDKTSDPTAPEKFLLIQKAKDILSDEAKKKVIDDHFTSVKQREQYEDVRNKAMDEKRKRFRDDLEQRVSDAKSSKKARKEVASHEDILTHELAKNSKVLAAMRKENESIIEQAREEARRRHDKKNEDFAAYSRQLATEMNSKTNLRCAIKVKWRKSLSDTVSTEQLRLLFGAYGNIEDIVLDKEKKSTALLYYSTGAAASAAIDAFAVNDDFRVSFLHSASAQSTNHDASETSHTIFTNNAAINEVLQDEMINRKRSAERETVLNPFQSPFSFFIPSSSSETTSNSNNNSSTTNTTQTSSLASKEQEVLKKMMEAATMKKRMKEQEQAVAGN